MIHYVGNLRRNLETLFCPRLKVSVPMFGGLTPLNCWRVRSAVGSFRNRVRLEFDDGPQAGERKIGVVAESL
jgi:hypothetical protein